MPRKEQPQSGRLPEPANDTQRDLPTLGQPVAEYVRGYAAEVAALRAWMPASEGPAFFGVDRNTRITPPRERMPACWRMAHREPRFARLRCWLADLLVSIAEAVAP